jgi:UDP-N-acetylmuramoyl-tripeptide--D-alanyl-D-alanine ligase
LAKSLLVVFLTAWLALLSCRLPAASARPAFEEPGKLSREILGRSLLLGRSFLLRNQKPEGNFFYEYDFVARRDLAEDNQVRQAGALWSLALIHADRRSAETFEAVKRGVGFFNRNSKEIRDGRKYPVYPKSKKGRTGTVALLTLTLIDFLRAEKDFSDRGKYESDLGKYLKFLLSLRMPNGQFYEAYRLDNGKGEGGASPYFDGESLLALVKAAKYAGRGSLQRIVLESAETMHQKNVVEPLRRDRSSGTTKGFYQWGSMAYYELYTSGWPGVEAYAKRVLGLAHWMAYVQNPLRKKGNTAYAFEGLVSAWEVARLTGQERALRKIGEVIDRGLLKLSSWQVGGDFPNAFLQAHPTNDPRAVGGVMNGEADPVLRIDVTQHQMHAVILARRFIYKKWRVEREEDF